VQLKSGGDGEVAGCGDRKEAVGSGMRWLTVWNQPLDSQESWLSHAMVGPHRSLTGCTAVNLGASCVEEPLPNNSVMARMHQLAPVHLHHLAAGHSHAGTSPQ
jgi:hypothetical protein